MASEITPSTLEQGEQDTAGIASVPAELVPVSAPSCSISEATAPTEELPASKPSPKKVKRQLNTENLSRPTLRPRKVEPPPPEGPSVKKPKKAQSKEKPKIEINVVADSVRSDKAENMMPPELPLAEVNSSSAEVLASGEMPLLHSETSSSASSSETRSESRPPSRRRPKSRLSRKKRKGASVDDTRKVPSPTLAEGIVYPAGPESTATQNEVSPESPSCLCTLKPRVFVSSQNNPGDLTCQALDCMDGRVVGCCNPLPSTSVGLHRSSSRTPYIMICAVHQQRLLRHNCCPGCGLYCTQGKYYTCRKLHQYHKRCVQQAGCLHCGDLSPPKTISLTLKSRRDPVFLPKPRPTRASKPARMSLRRQAEQRVNEPLPVTLPPEVEKWMSENRTAKVGPPDPEKYTFKHLLNAVRAGDAVMLLKVMSAGINPNHEFAELQNQTPLHIAASMGHVVLIHLLLQSGLSIDLPDAGLNTPLALGVAEERHDVVKYLIKAGASLIIRGQDGMTPLHSAAKNGNFEACSLLLSAQDLPRRYVDSLDDGGWTPLVWAAEFNHCDVARLLIREGADPLIRDYDQNIALHWAAFGGSLDVVDLLLSRGSDISAVNVDGDTPLHIAARQDKYDCVLLLLARGAQCNLMTKTGDMPRDCAPADSPIVNALNLNMELSQLIAPFTTCGPRIVCPDVSNGKERDPIQCVNSVDGEPGPRDFTYLTESCFTSRIAVDRTITSMESCTCEDNCTSGYCACSSISFRPWYDADRRLCPEFTYNDPPMIFECNQGCCCNKINCHNRVVQNGLSCRFQIFRTKTRGWGVKSLGYIPKGSYVCEYIGEIISDSEADQREDDSYLFDLDNRDGETYCIDARRYGNVARFINHKCVPNLVPVHVFVEHHDLKFPRIAFFASQDIQADEELGYNYGEKFWVIKWKTFLCTCSSEKCMYSEETIKTTLENYHRKLRDQELLNGGH